MKRTILILILATAHLSCWSQESINVDGINYKLFSFISSYSKSICTAEVTCLSSRNIETITIPSTIVYDGNQYTVTKIASHSVFNACPKLKQIKFAESSATLTVPLSSFIGCQNLDIISDRPIIFAGTGKQLYLIFSHFKFNKSVIFGTEDLHKRIGFIGSIKSLTFEDSVTFNYYAFDGGKVDTIIFNHPSFILPKYSVANRLYVNHMFVNKNLSTGYDALKDFVRINKENIKYIHVPEGYEGNSTKNLFIGLGFPSDSIVQPITRPKNLKTTYKFVQTQAGTILEYIDISHVPFIDSLTITGFLNEQDVKIINQCSSLKYLDVEWTYATSRGEYPPLSVLRQKDYAKLIPYIEKSSSTVGSFKNHKCIETVKMPVCADVGWQQFSGCKNLRSVKFPRFISTIWMEAFKDCINLNSEVVLSSYLKNIYKNAFQGCTSITKIDLRYSNAKIEDDAFNGCVNLKVLYLPKKSESISTFGGNSVGVTIYAQDQQYLRYSGPYIRNSTIYFSTRIPANLNGACPNIYYVPQKLMTAFYAEFGDSNPIEVHTLP